MFACTAPQRSHSIHTPRCASRPRARADLTVARAVEHKPSVVVIGAGVLGLTCALTLAEHDKYDITVIAEKFSPDTTSDVAAAFWYPFLVRPKERADAWALQSYSWFVELRAREGRRTVRRGDATLSRAIEDHRCGCSGMGERYRVLCRTVERRRAGELRRRL